MNYIWLSFLSLIKVFAIWSVISFTLYFGFFVIGRTGCTLIQKLNKNTYTGGKNAERFSKKSWSANQ